MIYFCIKKKLQYVFFDIGLFAVVTALAEYCFFILYICLLYILFCFDLYTLFHLFLTLFSRFIVFCFFFVFEKFVLRNLRSFFLNYITIHYWYCVRKKFLFNTFVIVLFLYW